MSSYTGSSGYPGYGSWSFCLPWLHDHHQCYMRQIPSSPGSQQSYMGQQDPQQAQQPQQSQQGHHQCPQCQQSQQGQRGQHDQQSMAAGQSAGGMQQQHQQQGYYQVYGGSPVRVFRTACGGWTILSGQMLNAPGDFSQCPCGQRHLGQ